MCNTDKNKKHQDPNSTAHHQEHEAWNRRAFLQAIGIAGAGSIALGTSKVSAAVVSPITKALNESDNGRSLVLIRLKGGNDGLNTIVPLFDYDSYAAVRPNIALGRSSLHRLNDDFGLPDFMQPLQSLWGDGKMKVVHGVGYEDASLSHFRASDIWASTVADEEVETGWLGRYYDQQLPNFLLEPPDIPPAIQIGSLGNLAFEGLDANYAFSVADPQQLYSLAQNGWQHDVNDVPDCTYGSQLAYLRSTTNTTFKYAGVINNAYEASNTQADYENNSIAEQFSIVARLLKGNLGTKIYMVTLDGLDTHADQTDRHARQMSRLTNAIDAFYKDLESYGNQDEVLCMTISEFGRRVEQNGSQGTDHGTAAPMMLFGGGLQGNGFIGNHPSLTDLDQNGNMFHDRDFRDIYSTVLTDWLCIPQAAVNQAMYNTAYENVSLGFNCNTASAPSFNDIAFKHVMMTRGSQNILRIEQESGARLKISIYNMLGQFVGQVANEFYMPGRHEFDVKASLKQRLATGQYLYKIETNGNSYSSQFVSY
ncbi:DUF1501 domain-containing protein [Nonlabens ponticola]|uniref:DUF1501 domain-containing protein n=1 Tax=Nonlabens ponticola TaxID=2496866 RepID=A0A3S9MV24_9FLAO|nr:DUF1501 domain-containing protein [Nonlabens ponticola]AZQ43029.1 DUF1501 domain-containing protein [Nonlabens ponticola]